MVNTALKFMNADLTFGVCPKRESPAASGFIYLKQYDHLVPRASVAVSQGNGRNEIGRFRIFNCNQGRFARFRTATG